MENPKNIKAGQYVVFTIQDKLSALAIEEVIEIIRMQTISNVPGVKDYIPGMINLRGKIIPVIDLHKRYNMSDLEITKKTRMVIVQNEGEDIGLIVDEVTMVIDVEEKDIEQTLEMFNSLEKDCYRGFAKVNGQLIGILNIQKVLYPEYELEVNGVE
ncbi:chemotaxis protein CheW [Calidifontibacillus oryziterrae]|uniref:chemotaxis protein CheW n=1 Tax=Calidifontibacillus oryziterrae TaxID=1191699 RepID=UPI0002F3103D|nr:chemotaxis protein CheW [Calidifontibacillus oryziterrae]